MTTLKLKELSAITLCIFLELKGSDKRLHTFNRLQRLDGNDSINSLMNDLLSFGKKVELGTNAIGEILKGRKREYWITDIREDILKRKTNYNGRQIAKEQDEIIKEYVFNRLLVLDFAAFGDTHSIYQWTNAIIPFDIEDNIDKEDMIDHFKQYYFSKESDRVVNNFIERVEDRNKGSVELALNHLHKEEKIRRTTLYFTKSENGRGERVNKKDYNIINDFLKVKLADVGMKYNYYIMINNKKDIVVSSENLRKVEQVKEMLIEEFMVEYIYKLTKVDILGDEFTMEDMSTISKLEAENAFIEKLIVLTRNNQTKRDRDDYNTITTGFVEDAFQNFNYYSCISLLGYSDSEIEKEIIRLTPTKEQIAVVQDNKKEYAMKKVEEFKRDSSFITCEDVNLDDLPF